MSVVTAEQSLHIAFGRKPPTDMSIYKRYKCLIRLAAFVKKGGTRRRPVIEPQVVEVPEVLVR
jgi:hypothetical protein